MIFFASSALAHISPSLTYASTTIMPRTSNPVSWAYGLLRTITGLIHSHPVIAAALLALAYGVVIYVGTRPSGRYSGNRSWHVVERGDP